jgi:hypothetical protein
MAAVAGRSPGSQCSPDSSPDPQDLIREIKDLRAKNSKLKVELLDRERIINALCAEVSDEVLQRIPGLALKGEILKRPPLSPSSGPPLNINQTTSESDCPQVAVASEIGPPNVVHLSMGSATLSLLQSTPVLPPTSRTGSGRKPLRFSIKGDSLRRRYKQFEKENVDICKTTHALFSRGVSIEYGEDSPTFRRQLEELGESVEG